MIRIIIIFVMCCIWQRGHTALPEAIGLQPHKVCQIIFPTKIEKIRGGFNPQIFVLDQYENILYIQCLVSFPDTNLSVITDDSSCYLLDLYYTEKSGQNAHIIDQGDRIYSHPAAMASPSPSATPVIGSAVSEQPLVQDPAQPVSDFETILRKKDFILANNGVADKAMEVFLKGIYTQGNYIYFKLNITNNSELPYTYNYCGFAVVSRQKGEKTSYDRTELAPVESYIPVHTIEYRDTMTVIYKFEKFNYSNDRVLLIEMVEDNGERGLYFKVPSSTLLKARKI